MKKKKKLQGAEEKFGVKIVVDKSLDIYTGRVLFPESVRRANEMIKRSTNLEILKRAY